MNTTFPETDPKKIADRLCDFARSRLVTNGRPFNENTPFYEANIDSFALLELLTFCEQSLGVRVPDSHLTSANFTSMSTVAKCVAELASNNQPAANKIG